MKIRILLFLLLNLFIFIRPAASYSLSSFSNMSDVDTLLDIWGNEAKQNANNTSIGVDRSAPIFNTSYDWHSSVHAHYATMYVGTTLNQQNLVNNIQAKYDVRSVQNSLYYRPSGDESTYGYPWLLLYAEYLSQSNPQAYTTLKPLVQKAYDRAYDRMTRVNASQYVNSVSSGYQNYNFVALAVYRYAKLINDTQRMREAKNLVGSYAHLVNWSRVGGGDFFDPKAVAAWTYRVMNITGKAKQNLFAAYDSNLSVPSSLVGYSSHAKGKVMSAAWGFWLMYHETKQRKYLDAYIKTVNVVYQSLKRERYEASYFKRTGHWVPHFGVIALKLSKEYPVTSKPTDPDKPTDPEEPVLKKDITVSPMTFTNYMDVEFPVANDNSLVRIELINWAGRTVKSITFRSNKGNQKKRVDGLSSLWAQTYTLNVTVGTKVYQKTVRRQRWIWSGWRF